jgi:integrase
MTIIAKYKASPEFTRLAPSTRRSYSLYIKLIEDAFGNLPLAALADRRVRGEFKTWRDGFAATPRKADFAWTVLARIMSFAKDRGMITTNPAKKEVVSMWLTAPTSSGVSKKSPPCLVWPHMRLSWRWCWLSGPGNVRATCCGYLGLPMNGSHLRFRQSKTGRRMTMPDRHSAEGAARRRRTPHTVDPDELLRAPVDLGRLPNLMVQNLRAGVSGLTFHDLRGSAVVRLALAEATLPQIATFTGHSLKDVEAILDAHYLGRDVQLAEAAVLKLEQRTKL